MRLYRIRKRKTTNNMKKIIFTKLFQSIDEEIKPIE